MLVSSVGPDYIGGEDEVWAPLPIALGLDVGVLLAEAGRVADSFPCGTRVWETDAAVATECPGSTARAPILKNSMSCRRFCACVSTDSLAAAASSTKAAF